MRQQADDASSVGHHKRLKTLDNLQQLAYWVGLNKDVEVYCRECYRCQETKPPAPKEAPLISMPIGRPWQMVLVNILEVPISLRGNRYLLVIQDYFTKWPGCIPLKDQTPSSITSELVELFSTFGIFEVIHSDKGQKLVTLLRRQTLYAFCIEKFRTTAYHPQGDGILERLNRSLMQMFRAYVQKKHD